MLQILVDRHFLQFSRIPKYERWNKHWTYTFNVSLVLSFSLNIFIFTTSVPIPWKNFMPCWIFWDELFVLNCKLIHHFVPTFINFVNSTLSQYSWESTWSYRKMECLSTVSFYNSNCKSCNFEHLALRITLNFYNFKSIRLTTKILR